MRLNIADFKGFKACFYTAIADIAAFIPVERIRRVFPN